MADVRVGEGVRRVLRESHELGHRREHGRIGHVALALEDDLVDADRLEVGEYRLALLVAPDEYRGRDAATPRLDRLQGVGDRSEEIPDVRLAAGLHGLDDLDETFARLVVALVVAAPPLGPLGGVVHVEGALHRGFAEDEVDRAGDRAEVAAREV